MTRDEKILQFFNEHITSIRWCEPPPESEFNHLDEPERSRMIRMSKMCGCLGCINGGRAHAWRVKYPDEQPIQKDEFERLKAQVEVPERKTISFTFKSI